MTDAGTEVEELELELAPAAGGWAHDAYRLLLDHLGEGAAVLSGDGVVLYANPALGVVLGRRRDELVGRPLAALLGDDELTITVGRWDHRLLLADGTERDLLLGVGLLDVDDDRPPLLGLTAVDVSSDRARAHVLGQLADKVVELRGSNVRLEATEATLRYQATHDALTGLPNRTLVLERLREALDGREPGEVVAVLYCDLDRFKQINDTYGHAMGDEVLRRVATRMREEMRAFDTVARLSGDEFAIVARRLPDAEAARAVAARIVDAVASVIRVGGDLVASSVSVGVAVAPAGAVDAEVLLRRADTAMYRSKELGRNRFVVYEPSLGARQQAREEAETALRDALRNDGVVTWFQPVLEVVEGRVVGMEALARLRTADGMVLASEDFIAVAEDTDLVVPLGRRVLADACAQAAAWADGGLRVPVHVNLSSRQVADDLLGDVETLLRDTGLPPTQLRFELTERALVELDDPTRRVLRRLHELGVGLGIDDFGTGYTSLAALRRVPVEFLKIDRSFVADMVSEPDDRAIVAAVITLATTLRLRVIAEGVEDIRQLAALERVGCRFAQGHLFSPALAPADATRWLRARRLSERGEA